MTRILELVFAGLVGLVVLFAVIGAVIVLADPETPYGQKRNAGIVLGLVVVWIGYLASKWGRKS